MQNTELEKQNLMRLYQEIIVPFLYSQEDFRKSTYIKVFLLKLLSFFILICNMFAIWFLLNWLTINFIELNSTIYFLLCIFFVSIFYFSNYINLKAKQERQKYCDFINKTCIDKIIEEINNFKKVIIDDSFVDDKKEYKIWEETYNRTHLDIKQRFMQYTFDNIIDGDMYLYKSANLKAYLNKVKLTKTSSTRYINRTENVFNGLVISIDLPKNLFAKALITTNVYSSLLETDKLIKIKKIDNNFKLYAKQNFNIDFITDEFISLIENLVKSFKTKKINFLISKNKIFITIEKNEGILEIAELSKKVQCQSSFYIFSEEIFALKQLFKYFESL